MARVFLGENTIRKRFFFWSYCSKIRAIGLARSDLFFSNRTISYIRIISSASQVHAHPMSPCMRTIFNPFTVPITHDPLTTVKRHVIISGTLSDLRCVGFFLFLFPFFFSAIRPWTVPRSTQMEAVYAQLSGLYIKHKDSQTRRVRSEYMNRTRAAMPMKAPSYGRGIFFFFTRERECNTPCN